MTQARVEALPRARAAVYLRRGENLLATMALAEKSENPDGVATTAVQAAICLADAFTIARLELRSRGQDHNEVMALIARSKDPAAAQVAKLVRRILSRKSEVEYGHREVSRGTAVELAGLTRELAKAVRSTAY